MLYCSDNCIHVWLPSRLDTFTEYKYKWLCIDLQNKNTVLHGLVHWWKGINIWLGHTPHTVLQAWGSWEWLTKCVWVCELTNGTKPIQISSWLLPTCAQLHMVICIVEKLSSTDMGMLEKIFLCWYSPLDPTDVPVNIVVCVLQRTVS